jgi:hypothetical protein
MNERIEKLWDEAADSIAAIPNGRNNFWETQENFMEKFAELIVGECYLWAKENGGLGCEEDFEALKEHFGVEDV